MSSSCSTNPARHQGPRKQPGVHVGLLRPLSTTMAERFSPRSAALPTIVMDGQGAITALRTDISKRFQMPFHHTVPHLLKSSQIGDWWEQKM